MRTMMLGAIAMPILMTGCVNPDDERGKALAVAQARCETQGKQVLTVSMKQEGVANVTPFHTILDFQCVGPGEEGYVTPAAK